jgi:hypothetical protein
VKRGSEPYSSRTARGFAKSTKNARGLDTWPVTPRCPHPDRPSKSQREVAETGSNAKSVIPEVPRLFGIAFDPQCGLTAAQVAQLAQRAAIVRITRAPGVSRES